jgi:hypothetical protein
MKKINKNTKSTIRKKLALKREHIVQLAPLQMSEIHGASAVVWSCAVTTCGKPG